MPDATPVGDQLGQYADQVAALNQKIDRFFPQGADPVVPDDPAYKALRAQRDVLTGKARDLIATAKKSGADAPDFTGLLRKASARLKGDNTGAASASTAAPAAAAAPSPYLQKFREQYPAYKDVPDAKLADGLYTKFYAGKMSRDAFNAKIGLSGAPAAKPVEIPQTSGLAASVEAQRTGMAPPAGVTGAEARALQEKRNRLYKQLQAEGIKEPERDPRFQAVNRKYAQAVLAGEHEVAGFGPLADAAVVDSLVRGAGRALGKGVVEGGVALGKAVGKGTEAAARLTRDVLGTPGQRAMQDVLQEAKQRAATAAAEETGSAKTVGALEQRVADTQKAAEDLDAKLVAQPKMPEEQFGKELRQTTQDLFTKHAKDRAEKSGFTQALASAGDELRVPTDHIRESIDQILKTTRNPGRRRTLEDVKTLLTTEGADEAHDALSIASADDLRKTLSDIIRTKHFGPEAVDKATLVAVKNIKNQLVQAATDAWTPYKEALGKWSTLSRPLEIVERNGGLRKVLATDPVSTDYALTEAQVVGQVIGKARAGSKTIERLISENPSLRDSARLYFTEDLFGKGVAPTEAMFRTWLKNNERPLRQAGLYDEFRSMGAARQAAQQAVEDAKGELSKASLRETELGKKLSKTHAAAAEAYNTFVTDLNNTVPKKIPDIAERFFKRLVDDGKLDQQGYDMLLKKLRSAEEQVGRTNELRKKVRNLALLGTLSYGGYEAWRGLRYIAGW